MPDRRAIARDLLAIGAVELRPADPFTWASGIRSPIYCDNRVTLSDPAVRRRIADAFTGLSMAQGLEPDVIAGTATAGIPHAAWLADRLNLPMVYVRSAAKEHGRGNRIEGRLPARARVLLVEDTVSTGGSAIGAIEALREAGAEVVATIAIFDYGFSRSAAAFRDAGVALHALATYDDLISEALAAGLVSEDDLSALAEWRQNPEEWGR